MDTPGKLVGRLMSDIGAVADGIQDYVRRPGADFTRTRLMGAGDVIRALVCMGTGTLGCELAPGWLDAPAAPSASAFCQARAKIEPEALRQLLLRFAPAAPERPMPGGLRLAAVDGTEVAMQRNPRDAETHNPRANGSSGLGYNSVYATALLDMAGNAFLDAVVQPGPAKDEPAAFRELVDRCDPALTVVGDRNFASYNNFAHCLERGVGFVVRLKEPFAASLLGPGGPPGEADEDVELLLSRSQRASLRAQPGYRRVSPGMKFDYLGGRGSSYRTEPRHQPGAGRVHAGAARGGLRHALGDRDRLPRPQARDRPRQAALRDRAGRRAGGLRADGPVQLLLGHGGARPAGRRRRTARGAQARPRRELRGRRAGLPRGPVAARRARRRPPREDRGERLPGQAREELREAPQALVPGELRLPLLDSARRYGQCYHARRFRASAKLRARTCDPCLAKLA